MQIVRLHHDRDDSHRYAQPNATRRLLMDQRPVPFSALPILFGLRGVIERELDVVKGSQFIVLQNRNTMTIGSDGELYRFRLQVAEYCLEVWMHAVLTGAKIHRPHGQAFHDHLHLFQGKTISASWIAIAKSAREITF